MDDNDEMKLAVAAVDVEGAPLVDGAPEDAADVLTRGVNELKTL